MISPSPPPQYEASTHEANVHELQEQLSHARIEENTESNAAQNIEHDAAAPPPVTFQVKGEEVDIMITKPSMEWIPSPPPYRSTHRLAHPVVIPRIASGRRFKNFFPFLRAYAPVLEDYQIDSVTFLAFVDNLSVAQLPPPLRMLHITRGVVRKVRHHVGKAAEDMPKGPIFCRKFLKLANEEYFNPRGLKVRLCKDDELAKVVGLPADGGLLSPLDMRAGFQNFRDRRMKVLAPYIAPLTLDVPPPTEQRYKLDKITAKKLQWKSERKNKREAKKFEKVLKKQTKREAKQEEKHETKNPLNLPDSCGRRGRFRRRRWSWSSSSSSSSSYSSSSSSSSADSSSTEEYIYGVGGISLKKMSKADKIAKKWVGKMEYLLIENF